MTAEIIRFPKPFQERVKKTQIELARHPIAAAIKKPLAQAGKQKAKSRPGGAGGGQSHLFRSVWSILWTVLVLCWPIISFLFWIDIIWHGFLAFAYITTPHTHYGYILLAHCFVFFFLGVIRFIVPKDI